MRTNTCCLKFTRANPAETTPVARMTCPNCDTEWTKGNTSLGHAWFTPVIKAHKSRATKPGSVLR